MAVRPYSVIAKADGTAVVEIRSDGLWKWVVAQVSTEMPQAPIGALCYLRRNTYPVTPMIPTGSVASGEPPVEIGPGDVMTVEWTGLTPGISGRVTVFYDAKRR
jgi:hypothetical protein